jgi:cellulase/cellobiase CelA1
MLCVVVFVVTFVLAISANPKYDVFEIVEIFESECVGNAKTKM